MFDRTAHIHHHHYPDHSGSVLWSIHQELKRMNDSINKLTAADAALQLSVVAAIAYIHTIPQQISDAVAAFAAANPGVDTGTLDSLAADFQKQADTLTAALPAPVAAAAVAAASTVNNDPAPTTAETVTAAASNETPATSAPAPAADGSGDAGAASTGG